MPEKIVKKRTARKIGEGTYERNKRQETGRKRLQSSKNSDAIIADSISSLRLKPKGGAEVFLMSEENTSVQKIYNDLKSAYVQVTEMLKVEGICFKALEQLTMRVQLDWIITRFRKLLPFGFDFEIRQSDTKTWCFVIFQELDQKNDYDVFFVENVIKYLQKNNRRLHDLFVEFLKILVQKIHIDGWWNSYADTFMEQEIEEFEQDGDRDEKYYQTLSKSVDTYKKGMPAKYEKKIKLPGYINPLLLSNKLKLIKQDKKLVNVLINGCKLLNEPYDINDFGYAFENRMNDAGLRWEDQAAIMWTSTDAFFDYHEEFLNTEAQEGLFPPTIFKVIDKNIQESDFKWLKNGADWPVKFSNLIYSINETLRQYEHNS
ncbi:MAG TPA: hypothetical protein VN722_08295 [Hanamia sp.]|nr:hypothetical protein [Hanamia sp.]